MKVRAFVFCGLLLSAAAARAITIQFDYSMDTSGFFTSNPTAKTDLEAAAQFFDAHLTDTLTAISPGGFNSWTADFTDPSTGSSASVVNLSISQNEILIYAGGENLGSGVLGEGGPGGFSASGSQSFLDTVKARGQSGALASTPTDYGPWGGSVSFGTNVNWYFDSNPSTTERFGTQADFYSVALHELGHVLGIGTADSWFTDVSGTNFVGRASEAAFGAPVPLDSGTAQAHWADGTMSTIYGTSTSQEAAMSPALTDGTRKVFTSLDMAGLKDVGWTLAAVPEPPAVWLAAMGLFVGGTMRHCARHIRR
jgi:hypothetical protein